LLPGVWRSQMHEECDQRNTWYNSYHSNGTKLLLPGVWRSQMHEECDQRITEYISYHSNANSSGFADHFF
jgi:hypothetical protein